MNSLYPEVDGTSLTYSSVLVELYTYTSSIEPFYFKGQGNFQCRTYVCMYVVILSTLKLEVKQGI